MSEDDPFRYSNLPGCRNPEPVDLPRSLEFSLSFGQLGNVEKLDRSTYDDKLTTNPDYMFDGVKHGAV